MTKLLVYIRPPDDNDKYEPGTTWICKEEYAFPKAIYFMTINHGWKRFLPSQETRNCHCAQTGEPCCYDHICCGRTLAQQLKDNEGS